MGQCQSAIADALDAFDRIDILLICRSEALIGTIEELHQSARTETLVKDQFETNFFAPVNIIRALLPSMREKRNGHIVVLTGICMFNMFKHMRNADWHM
jgi:NAD(P)-dependent dehydrogenase (short-subunit alcohol dehydrogenase family)